MFISKRILIISGIVAVVLAGVLGFGFAFAFSHTNQASTQSATPTTVASVTSVTSGQKACILGIVQSLSNHSFVVSANQGKRVLTVTVNDQTTYTKQGNQTALSLADVAVGNRVRVAAQGQCTKKDTTIVAQSIVVLTAAGGSPIATGSPTP